MAGRTDENIVSGPQLHVHILVREGNLSRDHQGRETRSVSIETTYSDSKASPKAAGKCCSLQMNSTRECVCVLNSLPSSLNTPQE